MNFIKIKNLFMYPDYNRNRLLFNVFNIHTKNKK